MQRKPYQNNVNGEDSQFIASYMILIGQEVPQRDYALYYLGWKGGKSNITSNWYIAYVYQEHTEVEVPMSQVAKLYVVTLAEAKKVLLCYTWFYFYVEYPPHKFGLYCVRVS